MRRRVGLVSMQLMIGVFGVMDVATATAATTGCPVGCVGVTAVESFYPQVRDRTAYALPDLASALL
jgi:hypothetical protein